MADSAAELRELTELADLITELAGLIRDLNGLIVGLMKAAAAASGPAERTALRGGLARSPSARPGPSPVRLPR